MPNGKGYQKGGSHEAAAAMFLHHLMAGLPNPWGKGYGKGGKGYGGQQYWSASEHGQKGAPSWGKDRRHQWPCPECDFPNRGNRQNCHKCGEPKPGGTKHSGKGGGKAGARRGHSPIGANGGRPLLGNHGQQRGAVLQGRATGEGMRASASSSGSGQSSSSPAGGPRFQQHVNVPRQRYVDVAATSHRAAATATPPQPFTVLGNGAKGGDGKGRRAATEDSEGDFTVVDYKAGKKPRVGDDPGFLKGAAVEEAAFVSTHLPSADETTQYYQVGDGGKDDDDHDVDDDQDHDYDYEGDAHDEDGGCDERECHEQELADAKEQVRQRRDTFHFLRDHRGRNHQSTKAAYEDLVAAEREQARIKGPRTWWQVGRKDARRKQVLLRRRERLAAQIDEREERFQEICYAHQEEQQADRDELKQVDVELGEIDERDRAYAEAQGKHDGQKPGEEEADAAQRELLQKAAGKLACLIEKASDEVREELNAINSDMGALHSLLTKGVRRLECEEPSKPTDTDFNANAKPPRGMGGASYASGRDRNAVPQGTKAAASSGPAQSAPMQWETEGTERTRQPKRGAEGEPKLDADTSTTTSGTPATPAAPHSEYSPQSKAAQKALDDATAQLQAARQAAKHQRALDKLRGRVLAEKARLLEEKQREAGIGTLDNAHNCTPEQLELNTKIVEQHNQDIEAEAERLYAQMSEDEKAKLLEAEAYW